VRVLTLIIAVHTLPFTSNNVKKIAIPIKINSTVYKYDTIHHIKKITNGWSIKMKILSFYKQKTLHTRNI